MKALVTFKKLRVKRQFTGDVYDLVSLGLVQEEMRRDMTKLSNQVITLNENFLKLNSTLTDLKNMLNKKED